ncbi:MAG: hypothetical protein WBP59_08670 [Ilumatobacteraceae bacterium]
MSTDDGELERLRSLVGPSEADYRDLRNDLLAAEVELRSSMRDVGRLRGELVEMSVSLARARQDQDTMQRRAEMGPLAYAGDQFSEYWHAVVRPRLGAVARRVGLRRGA